MSNPTGQMDTRGPLGLDVDFGHGITISKGQFLFRVLLASNPH